MPKPKLALAFGSVCLDQKKVHQALIKELDPAILLGGSSYAEITNAGVTEGTVAVLLLDWEGAAPRIRRGPLGALAPEKADHGLIFAGLVDGYVNDSLARLSKAPLFGGITSGDYDKGIDHENFWVSHQYGPELTNKEAAVAWLDKLDGVSMASGFEHGWHPVAPPVTMTRCEKDAVYEIDGMPVLDYYRQFLGEDAEDEFFSRLIQRHGFALDGRIKLPVGIDREAGCVRYYPSEDMQDKSVHLIQSSRSGLVSGAKALAERLKAELGGKKPWLVLMVSCCTRKAILHSRMEIEVEAVRGVWGQDVPIFGYYSGGEIERSTYHTTTVCMLAFTGRAEAAAPKLPKPMRERCMEDLDGLLQASESILDNTESFLANLSRKSAADGERLRRQADVIHRYTPREVWQQVGRNAAKGVYDLSESEFSGCFLFMDVKGFTAYSEEHGPQAVVAALNRIFEPATEAVYAEGGDVDKYIGDCIFAAFREPRAAVKAALRLSRLAEGTPFTVRIGVNSGRAIRANLGSSRRREYTFIGDAVNLAQRLESNCTPGRVLLAEAVYEAAKDLLGDAQRRELRVKGRKAPVVAYDCDTIVTPPL